MSELQQAESETPTRSIAADHFIVGKSTIDTDVHRAMPSTDAIMHMTQKRLKQKTWLDWLNDSDNSIRLIAVLSINRLIGRIVTALHNMLPILGEQPQHLSYRPVLCVFSLWRVGFPRVPVGRQVHLRWLGTVLGRTECAIFLSKPIVYGTSI